MALAIFDLDNTLIAGDSDHAWGDYLVEHNLVDGAVYKKANDKFYQDYQHGCLDIDEFLAFSLKPLSQHSMATLKKLHQGFMRDKIKAIMLPKAKALIEKHKTQGDMLLIITATNLFVTEPIAKVLNIHNILATNPEIINDRYTGKVAGTPCFQHGKVTRLAAWLKKHSHDLEGSWFYSDSHNDLPLLEKVTHPVAVDPDAKLEATALEKGWEIITLR